MIGQRVITTNSINERLPNNTLGTVVQVKDDNHLLIQVGVHETLPLIYEVKLNDIAPAEYAIIKERGDVGSLVDPAFHPGTTYHVGCDDILKNLDIEPSNDVFTIDYIELTTNALTDIFRVNFNGTKRSVSYDFLTKECVTPHQVEFSQYTPGTRVLLKRPRDSTYAGLNGNTISTIFNQRDAYIDIAYIHDDSERTITNCLAGKFRPIYSSELNKADTDTFLDPLYRLGTLFKATEKIKNVAILNNALKPNDVVQLVGIEPDVNAFNDVFTVAKVTTGEKITIRCLTLADNFTYIGTDTINREELRVTDNENNEAKKFELPDTEKKKYVNEDFYREFTSSLTQGQLDNFFKKIVNRPPTAEERLAIRENPEKLEPLLSALFNKPLTTDEDIPISIDSVTICGFRFALLNNEIELPHVIDKKDIQYYTVALQKLTKLINFINGEM